LGFDLAKPTPDENTIRNFRERLTNGGALQALFDEFDRQLRSSGYLPVGGQIVDATLVSAPRQHNDDGEKNAIKEGKSANQIWPDKPAKVAQKDTDARWTVKFSKAKSKEDGTKHAQEAGSGGAATGKQRDIAIPTFGYKACPRPERGTILPLTGAMALSARMPSPMRPSMTARCCAGSSPPTTPLLMFGLTRRTVRRQMRLFLKSMAAHHASTSRSQRVS